MPDFDRPQAPGYLANLMARLFHEVAGEGLAPLGIRPEQFPVLVELWFSDAPITRTGLRASQEAGAAHVEALLMGLSDDGLLEHLPAGDDAPLRPSGRALEARDAAIMAARRANAAAAAALSDAEMSQLLALMNRVIDALKAARR